MTLQLKNQKNKNMWWVVVMHNYFVFVCLYVCLFYSWHQGDPRSPETTVTASLGDRVVLEVTRDTWRKSVAWNKDGDYIADWDDQTPIVIESVDADDAGIYECYYQGERSSTTQAVTRLIVRGILSFYFPTDNSIMVMVIINLYY